MTSVEQQAAKVIENMGTWLSERGLYSNQRDQVALIGLSLHIARALAEHEPPLLAPELPRPDRGGRWWPQAASIGNVNVNPAGEVVLHSGNFRDMQLHLSPAKARDLAAILTAAAAHAEKENES